MSYTFKLACKNNKINKNERQSMKFVSAIVAKFLLLVVKKSYWDSKKKIVLICVKRNLIKPYCFRRADFCYQNRRQNQHQRGKDKCAQIEQDNV